MGEKDQLIKRWKRLNTHAKLNSNGHKVLDRLYGYLSQISPVPKRKNIKQGIYFMTPNRELFLPHKFEYSYNKSSCFMTGILFDLYDLKTTYTASCLMNEFSNYREITKAEMLLTLKEAKKRWNDKFLNMVSDFRVRNELSQPEEDKDLSEDEDDEDDFEEDFEEEDFEE